ncbi:MAG: NAD-dependent succinate-semialdehyde dehydrogenase [Verrucomicrobiae bacterium]|nr:NAD-dependent succinate-semialdehyde dehydrogenase [Verrucomicrobiae bacterium]
MKTYPLYLDGAFVAGAATVDVVNPATCEPFAKMAIIDRGRLAAAIGSAHAAFGGWRATTAKARGEYLRGMAAELRRRGEEVARLIGMENGKPLAQARAEVDLGIDHLEWFAEEGRRAYGRVVPNQVEGKRQLVVRTPVGVVAAIAPWNFPLMLSLRKVAPALAAGCAVILKPARKTPLACAVFAECAHAAGVPRGVFQLVCGPSDAFAAEFMANPLCRKVSFTGSTEVGRSLIRGAADTVKPLSLELGGQAAALVFADADAAVAVDGVVAGKMRNTGQSCSAINRIYVERTAYGQFVDALAARVRALKVGAFDEPGAEIGPLIDAAALDGALEHIADAVGRGARVVCGGRRMDRPGFFLEPTVLADVPADALCMREETFAPVAPVAPFDTEEEAIGLANATAYGLSAYAFTRDAGRVFRLADSVEAGILGINDGLPTTTSNAPFGGVKQSGWGRELGSEGIDAFLDTKHVSIRI